MEDKEWEAYVSRVKEQYGDALKEALDGANCVAYDGCHKFYIARDVADAGQLAALGYDEFLEPNIEQVWATFFESCFLRFISFGGTLEDVVPQGAGAED